MQNLVLGKRFLKPEMILNIPITVLICTTLQSYFSSTLIFFFLSGERKDVQFLNVMLADFFVHKTEKWFCLSFNSCISHHHRTVGLFSAQNKSWRQKNIFIRFPWYKTGHSFTLTTFFSKYKLEFLLASQLCYCLRSMITKGSTMWMGFFTKPLLNSPVDNLCLWELPPELTIFLEVIPSSHSKVAWLS